MKFAFPSRRREEAAVLIASLFVGGVLGLVLGSYLFVIRSQYISTARSQAWRSALDMAEAGAEEALAHLNPGAGLPPSGAGQIIARSGDHWTGPNNGLYGPVTRTLDHGSYTVVITGDQNPIIYSTGYVAIPSMSANLSRAVRLTTASVPLTRAAVASQSNITMTGTGKTIVFADSFDSTRPNSGTRSNGDVVSLSGKISIGANIVKGDVFLGPTATGSGQVRGNTSHDLSIDFPDVVIPSQSWLTPSIANTNINGITYRYYFKQGGDYELTTSGAIYVWAGAGDVKLRIANDNFDAPSIHVENSGTAKLTIFLPGSSFKLSGAAVVDGGDPSKLTILGTPSTRSIVFTNQSSFTGTIYAPSADFTNNVSNNPLSTTVVDFRGALVANSVTVKGLCSFHFDENLLKSTSLSAGFFVTSWREL